MRNQRTNANRKVSVFIDGIPVLRVLGEHTSTNLVQLFGLAKHQLRTLNRPTLHLPDHIEPAVAERILSWAEDAYPISYQYPTRMPTLSSENLFENIDLYIALLGLGTRSAKVMMHVMETIWNDFSNQWRTWDTDKLDELEHRFDQSLNFPVTDVQTLLRVPLFKMLAHTTAYGLQNDGFKDTPQMQSYIQNHCPSLWDAVQAVGTVRYVIRRLVRDPTILPLPPLRRPNRRHPVAQQDEAGMFFPDLDDLEIDDSLPFAEGSIPSPSWFPSSPTDCSSPTSITFSRLVDMGFDGLVMAVGVASDAGDEVEDVEMLDDEKVLGTPPFTPAAVQSGAVDPSNLDPLEMEAEYNALCR